MNGFYPMYGYRPPFMYGYRVRPPFPGYGYGARPNYSVLFPAMFLLI